MNYPKTKQEWWHNAELLAFEFVNIFNAFNPKAAALYAEKVRTQDPTLVDDFDVAWATAPDSPGLHEIPGWSEMCDMCSESHLLR